jgi:cytochrome P450
VVDIAAVERVIHWIPKRQRREEREMTVDSLAPPVAITAFDPSDTAIYVEDRWREPFAELRRNMPVSYRPKSPYGPYWSVATLDLVQEVEGKPDIFSSADEFGGITIGDVASGEGFPNFIAMDRPRHTEQRKVVQPAFNPSEMARREVEIRARTATLFDGLPMGKTFDWVDRVSIELTIGMIAILFDFPWEDRRKLKNWSDWASNVTPDVDDDYRARFMAEMTDMLMAFDALLESKRAQPPADDILSRMIHSAAMGNLTPIERIANVALLIVGGNDTTRNSMSGFVYAMNQFPEEFEKLRDNPGLIANAAQEAIRWQSPVTHMRRTCTADVQLGGQLLKKGDKVVLWYVSANRDEAIFADPDRFDITRENARRHVAFGHGVHRCVGARLAELQLAILFEEILSRDIRVEMAGEPKRLSSCFLHGFTELPVRIVAAS